MSTVPSDLCRFFTFVIASTAIVLAWLKDMEERNKESQKIDNLPILETCRSGTLVILSSKVNGLVAHGSAQ